MSNDWLDTEKSGATVTIRPMLRGSDSFVVVESEIEIRPYPNPLSFGGAWGVKIYRTVEKAEADLAETIEGIGKILAMYDIVLQVRVVRRPLEVIPAVQKRKPKPKHRLGETPTGVDKQPEEEAVQMYMFEKEAKDEQTQ